MGLLPRLDFLLSVARQEAFSAWVFPPSHEQRLSEGRRCCKIFLGYLFSPFCNFLLDTQDCNFLTA